MKKKARLVKIFEEMSIHEKSMFPLSIRSVSKNDNMVRLYYTSSSTHGTDSRLCLAFYKHISQLPIIEMNATVPDSQ